MKIALINPLWTARYIPPTNLAELAGYIRSGGYKDIHIIDLNSELKGEILSPNIIKNAVQIVRAYKPDIIGVTCNTIHVPFCSEFCTEYKKKYKTPVVLGGIHPTFCPDKMFKLTKADYIVRGEGEETFLELLNALKGNKSYKGILGLSYKKGNKIYHNSSRQPIKDLNKLPFPAYDLLFKRKSGNEKTEIWLSASRGCPFGCIFCSANKMWSYQRRKSIKRIIEEIFYIQSKTKNNYINFGDDCITLNNKWFKDLLKAFKTLNIEWSCSTRIDTIDKLLIKKMKESGCDTICHGLESGSDRIRKLLDKKLPSKFTNETIAKLVEDEIKVGIRPLCSFMIGVPTETETDMRQTLDLSFKLKQLGAETQMWIMTPYPDTKATQAFKDKLMKFDKWKALKQSDISKYDQFYFYKDFYNKYSDENPDSYIFRPEISLKAFCDLYKEAASETEGLEYGRNALDSYLTETKKSTYFIKEGMKVRLTEGKNILVILNKPFKSTEKTLKKLIKTNTKTCYLSIRTDKEKLTFNEKNRIFFFIKSLKERGVKICIIRCIPPDLLKKIRPLLKEEPKFPVTCEECNDLFKVNKNKNIELCTKEELYDECYAFNRWSIYGHFLKLAERKKMRKKKACFAYPCSEEAKKIQKKIEKTEGYLEYAQELWRTENIMDCMKVSKKIIKMDPRRGSAYMFLGFCQERINEYNKAIDALKKAESFIPDNPQINFSLFRCYKNIGLLDRADKEFDEGCYKLKSYRSS